MKKVAFMFVAALAMSFVACTGNKTAATEPEIDSVAAPAEEIVEEVIDTLEQQADTLAAEAEAVVEEAVSAQ